MAKCWKCHKRCQAQMACAWCGRGPMCLNCACDCKRWESIENELPKKPEADPAGGERR